MADYDFGLPVRTSKNNEPNTELNPIYVQPVTGISGGEIHNYKTATLAPAAPDNNTYTVPALKTFLLKQIWASASGKIKVEVKVGPPASEVAVFTAFNSASTNDVNLILAQAIEVPATNNVLVIVTNRDNQSQDVYSTIVGANI